MTHTPEAVQALARTIVCVNSKGGVGKTTIVANIAGQLAAAGINVLVVDFDARPGGIRIHLGVNDHAEIDQGQTMLDALRDPQRSSVHVIKDVRENLDLICGGEALGALTLIADRGEGGMNESILADNFAQILSELAPAYDLVLIDTAPQDTLLQDIALHSARWVLEPMKADYDSLSGIVAIDQRVQRARKTNPDLGYIGVIVPFMKANSTGVRRELREDLAAMDLEVPILDLVITPSDTVPWDCTRLGLLAHELVAQAPADRGHLIEFLRAKKQGGGGAAAKGPAPRVRGTHTAQKIADDYSNLANTLMSAVVAGEQ